MINLAKSAKIEGNEYNFNISYGHQSLQNLQIHLLGEHQLSNALLAICLSLDMAVTFPKIKQESIRKGLQLATWPGRTEWLKPNLLIDGTHYKEGARA